MALTVNTQNEENSLVVRAIITSDNNINFYDKMQTDAFRIDIADKFYALTVGNIIKEKLELVENPDLTPEEREEANNDIAEYETRIGTPVITIDKNNFIRYYNSDDESLLENGVQIIADENSMVIRFVPLQNIPFFGESIDLCVLHCVVGFDFDAFEITDRKAFDVCLMPRLITGNIEKEDPTDPDPILPADAERPDYPFNGPEDNNNLYVNNGENTICDKTPLEIVKTSAYTTEYISNITGNDFIWSSLESALVDETAGTFINLPFTVNGESDVENIDPVESITAKIINNDSITGQNNTLSGVKVYEIIQNIKTTGTEEYLKDKIRISVDA